MEGRVDANEQYYAQIFDGGQPRLKHKKHATMRKVYTRKRFTVPCPSIRNNDPEMKANAGPMTTLNLGYF